MPQDFVKRDRTARLLGVAHLLYQHPQGLTARQIAERVGVDVRTAYRDLRALEDEVGVTFWQDGPRYYAERASFLPPLNLTVQEGVTLFLSARLMTRYQDYRDPHVVSAFNKLATILPTPVAQHVHASIASMARQPRDDARALLFDRLAIAWAEGRKVRIWYPHTSAHGHTYVNVRLVSPYFLEPNPSGHTHYLIGHDDFSGQVRTFTMERIKQVEVTEDRFEIPDGFDIDARLSHAWGVSDEDVIEVHLRFHDAAAAARARESRWHSSQREHARADGTVDITYEVGGLLEITHWVLGWGAAVEVIAPVELRKQIANTVRAQAALYADVSS